MAEVRSLDRIKRYRSADQSVFNKRLLAMGCKTGRRKVDGKVQRSIEGIGLLEVNR